LVKRVARDTAMACIAIAMLFLLWKRNIAAPLGVIGGGLLVGISFWAIRGTVDALVSLRSGGETGRISTGFLLVKFFTRHVIVALAAYGMMVRLHLDPMGLLAGVSALGVAVGVEALRDLRWRRFL
jgi:ATP synthase I chain